MSQIYRVTSRTNPDFAEWALTPNPVDPDCVHRPRPVLIASCYPRPSESSAAETRPSQAAAAASLETYGFPWRQGQAPAQGAVLSASGPVLAILPMLGLRPARGSGWLGPRGSAPSRVRPLRGRQFPSSARRRASFGRMCDRS